MNYNRNLYKQINGFTNGVTGSYRTKQPPTPPTPTTDTVTITTQPTDITCYIGDTATFSVVAVSDDETATLSYQWQIYNAFDETWGDISGATSATYTVADTSHTGTQTFRCIATSDKGGTATSNSATVTIDTDTVSITTQPGDGSVYVDVSYSIYCTAVSNVQGAVLSYQWQIYENSDWTDISGATSSTYTTSHDTAGSYVHRCIVTSDKGGTATSDSATETVTARDTITITAQPQSYTGYTGDTVTLSVTATSDNPSATLSYQWQIKNGATYDDISGATSSTYSVPTSTAGTERYRVIVSSDKGATDVTSNYADVTLRASDIVTFTVQPQSYEHTNTGIIATYSPLLSTPCTAVSDDNSAVMDYEYQCYDQNSSEWVTISNTGSTYPLVLFTTSAEVQIMYYDGVDYSYSTQTQPASCRCVATSSLGGTAISNTYNVTNVNPPQPPNYYIRATSVAGTTARFYVDDPDYEITSVSAKMGGSTITPTIGTGGKYITLPAVTRASGAKSYEVTLNGEFTYTFTITYYGSATLTSNASSKLTKSSGSWAAQTTTFTATLNSGKDYYSWDGITIGTTGSCTPSSHGSTTNTMTYTYTNTRTNSGFSIKGATTGHSGTSWTILTATLNIAP